MRSQSKPSKRSRRTFSPIVVLPGTPDQDESSHSPKLSACPTTTHEEDETTDELDDIDLYYKIWNQNRPDPGESNAEAAGRHQTIDDEYEYLKRGRRINKTQSKLRLIPLTPSTDPIQCQTLSQCQAFRIPHLCPPQIASCAPVTSVAFSLVFIFKCCRYGAK